MAAMARIGAVFQVCLVVCAIVMVASSSAETLDTGGVSHLWAPLYGADTWPAPMRVSTALTSQTIIGEFPFVAFGMPSGERSVH